MKKKIVLTIIISLSVALVATIAVMSLIASDSTKDMPDNPASNNEDTSLYLLSSNESLLSDSAWYSLRVNEKFEASFAVDILFDNPYDPDIVELWGYIQRPDGTTDRVPGFWYEGFERSLQNGTEILTPAGGDCWKLRYTPRQSGEFIYYAELCDKVANKTYRYPETDGIVITVLPSDRKGFLMVSPTDSSYLVYDDQSPFFGIGHNLMGWEFGGTDNMQGTYEFDDWFINLRDNHANMASFSFCEGNNLEWTYNANETPFSCDWNGLLHYNQQNAWKMDYRIQRAEEEGIFFRLMLLHWEDFDYRTENYPRWGWSRNPYNSANGGPNDDVTDFFASSESRTAIKKYLRYVIARYGYSSSLLAYQLWIEADFPDMVWGKGKSYAIVEDSVTDWHREMSEFIKENDINSHMVTTSFMWTNNGNQVWRLPTIDITIIQRYTWYNVDYNQVRFEIPHTLFEITGRRRISTGKPVLAGEFALAPGGDIQRDFDSNGVAFHTQLWVSLMSKNLGTAMHWTWGSYLHEYDLYYHYKPLAIYVAGEDFHESSTFNNFDDETSSILYMGLCTPEKAWIWVSDPEYHFENVRDGYEPREIADGSIKINGLIPGEYAAVFYDTYSGDKYLHSIESVGNNGLLELSVPNFLKDTAIKIMPVSQLCEWSSVDIPKQKNISTTIDLGDSLLLRAGGTGVSFLEDDFRFAYREVTGDFTLITKLKSLTYQGENVQAGLMVRASLRANSKFVFICAAPPGNVSLIKRMDSPIAEFSPAIEMPPGAGIYMKLVRQGDIVTAFVSETGNQWIQIGTVSISGIGDTLLIGASASATDKILPLTYIVAEFSDLKITQ